jgi:hypothetical protein
VIGLWRERGNGEATYQCCAHPGEIRGDVMNSSADADGC